MLKVCIQGLGFVGAAMAGAVAETRENGAPAFDVVSVDLATPLGKSRIAAIDNGYFPFETAEVGLSSAFLSASEARKIRAVLEGLICDSGKRIVIETDPALFKERDIRK